MKGTTPEGAGSEQEAARWVRGMFGRIAPRYDLANHLLSVQHRSPLARQDGAAGAARFWSVRTPVCWTSAAARGICCWRWRARAAAAGVGLRLLPPDAGGRREARSRRRARASVFESDALPLPIRDGSFDLISVAFGFRNLANYDAGLREMRRMLRPGGWRRSSSFPNLGIPCSEQSTISIRGGFFRGSAGR